MSEITFTVEGVLSDEALEVFADLLHSFPNHCPKCNFTDPKLMWILVETEFQCIKCKYVLLESDTFPSILD